MGVFDRGVIAVLAAGVVGLVVPSPVAAEPNPDRSFVVTAVCNEVPSVPGGDFTVELMPRGSVAFILGDDGEPTGEKLHLLSLDFAGFNAAGQLVFEDSMTWGNRSGQRDDRVFCSGSFDGGDGVTVFFDVLATRR